MSERSISPDGPPFGARDLSGFRNPNEQRTKILAYLECRSKFFPLFRRECPAHVHHRRQPHIRLVAAVETHGLVITHARERRLDLMPCSCEGSRQEAFDHL